MSNARKLYGEVLVALTVILIGLFLLCAQQRGTVDQGSDMTADDEQFKQELLEMLDMADEQKQDESEVDAVVFEESSSDSSDDVLALLMADSNTTPLFEAEEEPLEFFPAEEEEVVPVKQPVVTKTVDEVDRDMFLQVQNDVERLERLYDQRSGAADSLRRIIENRSGRIKDLEQRFASVKSSGSSSKQAMKSTRAAYDPAFIAAYEDARTQFERYDYKNAIQAFQTLLKQYPNYQLADNCQYWIAEGYYGMKQYQTAIIEFQKVFAYMENDKYDDAQLMIAQSYARVGQKERARSEFQTFLSHYTDSEYLMIAKRQYENI